MTLNNEVGRLRATGIDDIAHTELIRAQMRAVLCRQIQAG